MPSQVSFSDKIIDCHVHLAAIGDGENGCYISPRMLRSPIFKFLMWKQGLNPSTPSLANQRYINNLLQELHESQYIGKVVLLGMDGVYDHQGKLDQEATGFLVSNEYVLEMAKAYPDHFLAGVSINPQRRDALEELHRCVDEGAVLLKVLPNSQRFDPSNHQYKNFYRAMAQHHLPLLSHVGYEFSLGAKDQSLGDVYRLRTPLDEGVTVIAAHACSFGLVLYEKFHPIFLDLVKRYPNFYADISALTLPNRVKTLFLLRKHPEVHSRLLFGTDYPLPVTLFPIWGRVGAGDLFKITRTTNRFDRQYLICKTLGLHFISFGKLLQS